MNKAGPYIIPRDMYPVTIDFYRASEPSDTEPIYSITLQAPLRADQLRSVQIPALRGATGGEPVRVVVTYGDGTSSRHDPLEADRG